MVIFEEVERKVEESYTMQTDHNIYLTAADWDSQQTAGHVCNRRLDTKVADWSTLIGRGPARLCSDWFRSLGCTLMP